MWELATEYEPEFDWFEQGRLRASEPKTEVNGVQNVVGAGYEVYLEIGEEHDPTVSNAAGFDTAELKTFAKAVTPFTSDPDCVGLVWEGGEVQGGITFYFDGRPSEKLPDPDLGGLRVYPHGEPSTAHVPILGPLNEVHEIGIFTREFDGEPWQTNIDYWWPRSHEWLVCSFEDFGANYVGCSRECAEALLATDLLAREVAADSESRPAG